MCGSHTLWQKVVEDMVDEKAFAEPSPVVMMVVTMAMVVRRLTHATGHTRLAR